MPVYTYRREDGTTFDIKQSFSDAPLTLDPETGQHVVRVVQAAGIIFKGSGFYVNDSKGAKNSVAPSASAKTDSAKSETTTKTAEAAPVSAAKSDTAAAAD